jgi:tetratricopeptide (TPR) repeat protein
MLDGKPGEATPFFRKVIELKPDDAEARLNLGVVLSQQGKVDDAILEYRKVIQIRPDLAEAYCNLGLALRDKGEFVEALSCLRRGHDLGRRNPHWLHPTAQWVKECEKLVELDARLSRVRASKAVVAEAQEKIAFADLCYKKRHFEQAARFYEEALNQQPSLADDRKASIRYNAACTAALAGIGAGDDAGSLSEEHRVRRRRQARDWIRADLQQNAGSLNNNTPSARVKTSQALQHWLRDPDLKGLRDDDYLTKLPPEERAACRKLWTDVRELLVRVQEK